MALIDYEMTIGKFAEPVTEPRTSSDLVTPAKIPKPHGEGWRLVTAIPGGNGNTNFIQYIWERSI